MAIRLIAFLGDARVLALWHAVLIPLLLVLVLVRWRGTLRHALRPLAGIALAALALSIALYLAASNFLTMDVQGIAGELSVSRVLALQLAQEIAVLGHLFALAAVALAAVEAARAGRQAWSLVCLVGLALLLGIGPLPFDQLRVDFSSLGLAHPRLTTGSEQGLRASVFLPMCALSLAVPLVAWVRSARAAPAEVGAPSPRTQVEA
jgi:hypothetical protein